MDGCRNIAKTTGVFGKADADRGRSKFLLEQILFVQKKNDGGVRKRPVVADRGEQLKTFQHSILNQKSVGKTIINRVNLFVGSVSKRNIKHVK